MLRSALGKVAWVGRTASMVFGLALVLALMFGVASTALGANGDFLKLGTAKNVATKVTTLVGKVASGSSLLVKNPSGGSALGLQVNAGQAPLTVNAGAGKATNLDADKLDGKDSTQFANATHPHSGADITSGTVEADRIEDGAGSGLDADQLDGQNSSYYLPGGNLPSGSTVRGAFAEVDNAQAAGYSQYAMISFGYSISFTPTLHYVRSGAPTPTGCTGNAANPGAQPGHLCVFESSSFNLTDNSRNIFLLGNSGAAVPLLSSSGNTFYALGTWALTAP